VDRGEALAVQPAPERPLEIVELPPDGGLRDDPARSRGVPREDERRRQVEHDRHRRHARRARSSNEPAPRVGRHVGGVDDGRPARGEALAELAVEDREGDSGDSLVGVIFADDRPEGVRREHLGRGEQPRGEGRLARAGGADEDDERGLRDGDSHTVRVA
jgi:hypothetical protein